MGLCRRYHMLPCIFLLYQNHIKTLTMKTSKGEATYGGCNPLKIIQINKSLFRLHLPSLHQQDTDISHNDTDCSLLVTHDHNTFVSKLPRALPFLKERHQCPRNLPLFH